MSTNEPLLEVRDLTKEFAGRSGLLSRVTGDVLKAVDGVSFEILEGETLGLVGESGSGKSTIAYCVLRLIDPTSGSISFEGREITTQHGESLRRMRRQMQIIFQDPLASLNSRMTVGEIVAEPLLVHGVGDRKSRRAEVQRLLEVVGFDPSYINRRPGQFSGGQCQRIGIARALALNPKLIVCDEPVSSLDVSIQAQILNLLKDIQKEFGLTYLFIAHDLAVVRAVSDRIAVMRGGKIVEIGAASDVYDHPHDPYTQELLAAVPIPNPRLMRDRRSARQRLRVLVEEK